MPKKKTNKSQSGGQAHSPLALLAATCSKLEETGTSESPQPNQQAVGNQTTKQNNIQGQTVKVIGGSQVINAADLAQYMQLATTGQTLSIVNSGN